MNKICKYDEGYRSMNAYEMGLCYKCECNPKCPYKKKAIEDMFKAMGNPLKLKGGLR